MTPTLTRTERPKRSKRRRSNVIRLLLRSTAILFVIVFGMALGSTIFLFTTDAGEELREWAAGTLLTTQHDYWAKYTFLPAAKLAELKNQIQNPTVVNSAPVVAMPPEIEAEEKAKEETIPETKPRELVEVEEINVKRSGYFFKGKIMSISDPNRVHLVMTDRKDGRGDLLDEFTKKTNAIGIVNASGFSDPDGYGRGSKAFGLVIHDGKILQNYNAKGGETALALLYDGRLVTGNYTAKELIEMGARDAMSFRPQLIVNGKNMFADQAAKSWGIQPRTAVGQKADGTILFVVIDGRQPDHSIGATMKDLADLLQERGVVNAMAMDGGSSSMMLHNGDAITKTSCPYYRGRYLPNAWAVY
ncbi:UNVERIFIED_CONTAM: exopolysaccharide biosynthesis protein [Brevibacillus sp. OAP136]